MPDSVQPVTKANSPGGEPHAPVPPDVLKNCARLIASGEIEWPAELSAQQSAELELLVRQRRRKQMVKLIAARIAADIAAG